MDSSGEPVWIIADTDLPVLFRQYRDEPFIFDNAHKLTVPSERELQRG